MRFWMHQAAFATAWILIFATLAAAQQQTLNNVPAEMVSYPDLIVHNGKIVSMDDPGFNSDPGSIYQAMAIRGNRIQFLGSNDQILRYAGPGTRRIDLQGRTVVPGLWDTHNHLHNASVTQWIRRNPEKVETIAKRFAVTGKTYEELTRGIELVVKEQMARPLPGQWAMISLPSNSPGTEIGDRYLREGLMDRTMLDVLAPALPVAVNDLLNTAARNDFLDFYSLEMDDSVESQILNPRVDRLMIADRYFQTHIDELADEIERTLQYQAAAGFTGYASHIQGFRFPPAFRKLSEEGRLPMRLAFAHRNCQSVTPDPAACFLRLGDWQNMGHDNYWSLGVTLGAIDGGPPSFCSTMEVADKYKEWMNNCMITDPAGNYSEAIYAAFRSHIRYVVNHAYGDKALDNVMDIMEQAMADDPSLTPEYMAAQRTSSDHCGFYPSQEQMPRMKRLGMMFSCNANFLNRSAPWLPVFGRQYANRISPIASLIRHGIMPTAELEGLQLIRGDTATPHSILVQFITRRNLRDEMIAPEEAVDRVTAMKLSTVWPSYYVLREDLVGTLEPGKVADFVVYNKDYFTIPVEEIPTLFPLMVVMDGEVTNLRAEFAAELGAEPVGPQIEWTFRPEFDFGSVAMETD